MLTIKNRIRKDLLVFLALAAALTGCAPPGPRALIEGKKLLDQGRFPDAVEELKVAASLLSTNAQAWNYLGLAYQYAGQPTNAAQAYQKALALNHDLAEVHYNLGCLWLDQNKLEAAKSDLTTYTALRRNSGEGWLRLATAQLRASRSDPPAARAPELAAAEKSFTEAYRLAPQNPEALNGFGLVQLQRNRPREAALFFDRALKLRADYAPALLNLAIVSQLYLNNHQAALQRYREYLALKVHSANEDMVQSAARQLEQELNPELRATSPAASKPAAIATGHVESSPPVKSEPATDTVKPRPAPAEKSPEVVTVPAEPAIKPAQDIASTTPPPSGSPGKPAAAASNEKKPGFFTRMNTLNMLHRGSKTSSNATASAAGGGGDAVSSGSRNGRYHYQSLPKPEPGDASAGGQAFAQGLRAQQANHLTEAIQAYRQTTQLDPANYDAYYNWGLAATAAGSLSQALGAYEHALAIRPESPDARYNFALVLKQVNCIQDAVNELERLLSIYPNEPRAHLALGNLYAQQLHQPAKAREHYVKVLDLDPHNPQAASVRYWLIANP